MANPKQDKAYRFFRALGYSPEATSGIVGNLDYESGLDTSIEGDKGYSGGSSFGIAQFRGDRLKRLKSQYGDKWTDFDNQLKFVEWELNNTHKGAGKKLKNTRDFHQAGQIFSDEYEIPQKKYAENKNRRDRVEMIHRRFGTRVLDDEQDTPETQQEVTNQQNPEISAQVPDYVKQLQEQNNRNLSYFAEQEEKLKFAESELDKKTAQLDGKIQERNFINDLLKATTVQYNDPEQEVAQNDGYYQDGGKKKFSYSRNNQVVNNTVIENTTSVRDDRTKTKPLTKEQIEQKRLSEMREKQGELTQYAPQSKLSKVKEIALNPLTAMGYAARNETLPDNFSKGERNPLDYAIDVINPAQYVEDTKNVIQGTANGDLGQVGEGLLGVVPMALEAKSIYKGLKRAPLSETGDFIKETVNKGTDFLESKGVRTSIAPEARQGLRTNGITFNGIERPYQINNNVTNIGDDINAVYKEFTELEKIGTKEQYREYLESVFPKTTQPGIYYSGTKSPKVFNASEWNVNATPDSAKNLGIGHYFTPDRFKAENYGKTMRALLNVESPQYTHIGYNKISVGDKTTEQLLKGQGDALININNPTKEMFKLEDDISRYTGKLDEFGYPSHRQMEGYKDVHKIDEIAVPQNKQIHILGSNDDINLFKNYLTQGETNFQNGGAMTENEQKFIEEIRQLKIN